MLFSTVLKSRLERYFRKIGESLLLPIAIVDSENSIFLQNELFQSDIFEESGDETGFIKKSIPCKEKQCYLIAKIENGKQHSETVNSNLDIIVENILFFIQQEEEAQGLAQEVLEKYEELNLLYDMISELSTIFDEGEICRVILARAIKVLHVGSGAIAIQNSENKKLQNIYLLNRDEYQICKNPEKLLNLTQKTIEAKKEILYDEKSKLPNELLSCMKNKELWTMLSVPIQTGDNITGALILIGKINGEVFNSGDIKLLSAISGYAGITINSNRMVEQMRIEEALQHEMKLARNIQQSLLPRETPNISNLEITGICLPAADVGGDLFHFSKLKDSRWVITVADVSGHGLGAALTMASLKSTLRSESRDKPSPKEIIKNVNILMCEDIQNTGMYATLFCTVYDEKNKTLAYTNAGHPKPYLWQNKNKKFVPLDTGGLPVGMFENEKYENGKIQLNTGDFLVIYTNGLTEAKNERGEFYAEECLLQMLQKNTDKSVNNLLELILDSIKQFQGAVQQKDDITIVVLKVI